MIRASENFSLRFSARENDNEKGVGARDFFRASEILTLKLGVVTQPK